MESILSEAPQDYAAWVQTPLDYTINTFIATDSGHGVEDPSFSDQVMDQFRSSLGTRAVVANHGLNAPLSPAAVPIYDNFQTLYSQAIGMNPPQLSPLEFQTDGPTVDWPIVVAYGLTYHPTEIEIWDTTAAGGVANISLSELQSWAASLKGQ